jgi:DNA repair protein RecO (recombination protein O)
MSTRPRTIRTAALILRRSNFGEADRLITLLTPHHGKFDAIAKGVRKPNSKKTGHVELFMKSDLLIAAGRSIDLITQAEMIDPYLPIREDLTRGAYASYAAELLDRFTRESDDTHTETLFELLDSTFSRLCQDDDPRRVIRYYELMLLDAVGFRPELQECVVTHEEIQPVDQFFSYDGGGVVSPQGSTHGSGLVPLAMTTLKLLRHMQRSAYPQITALTISESLHNDAERILLGYIRFLLESRLQSIEFLRQIRQLPRSTPSTDISINS